VSAQPFLIAKLLLGALLLGTVATAAPQALVLDTQRSSIEVYVHATWVSFAGHVKKFQSDIAIDPADRRIDHAEVGFQFADLKTGVSLRDREMAQWEESVRFPEVHFKMVAFEPAETRGTTVRGSLIIHGVEHQISFPAALLVEGSLYAIDGDVPLDYRDFGLPLIRKFFFLTVDPHVRVRFHLQGRLASTTL
jgi:polyisoprenoid-binding protein YceI